MYLKERNIAFIDAQNLHLGTQSAWWKVDFRKLRVYLQDKFHVEEAYFFLWFVNDDHQKMYRKIQRAWFILEFRDHNSHMLWQKKWNVDVDIVFEVMHMLLEEDDFDKIVLVTGDGDYIKLVRYLIEIERFKKILFPNSKYSSLYKPFKDKFWMNLSQERVKTMLKFKEK